MKQETRIKSFEKMYEELTDPDVKEELQRKHRIKEMLQAKREDTGIVC